MRKIKKILLKISEFIYPVTCSGCGSDLNASSDSGRVCESCKSSFVRIKGFVCRKCGLPLDDGGEHCYICRHKPKEFHFDNMRSSYLYKGGVRKLILKFKYSDRMFLAEDFAADMLETMEENTFFKEADLIVPVPLNILRRIKRGYNQAELLARVIGKKTAKQVLTNVLLRKKITRPQFKLSKQERQENIKDSFIVKNEKALYKKNILLVDDIVTTSATVSACAKALKNSGARKVYVIALARD
jgi:Predicted amidophosphoribosyltransferases